VPKPNEKPTGSPNADASRMGDAQIAFIGCGIMGETMIAGLINNRYVPPEQIVASHPRNERIKELNEKYGVRVFQDNARAAKAVAAADKSIIVLSVKPQRLPAVLRDLQAAVDQDQLIVSIVAGATIKSLAEHLGNSRVVRAMPNTPSQIGKGITTWTCSSEVSRGDREMVKNLLTALGRELYVETENMIDMATSLSATGPTYIFMVMEALTDAGVHMGFSRDVAKELVQETMLGSVLFAMSSHKHPAELRNMVTSPGGTSAAAIYEMEKGGLRTVLSKAVNAAYRRAIELGQRSETKM
jgi:pyrroline-5-carboxylate reductase